MSDEPVPSTSVGRGRGRGRGHPPPDQQTRRPAFLPPSPQPPHSGLESVASNISNITERSMSMDSTRMSVDQPSADTPTPHGDATFVDRASSRCSLVTPYPRPDYVKEYNDSQKKVRLFANFFKMSFKQNTIYDYMVTFDPSVELIKARRRMVYEHLSEVHNTKTFAFDGTANLKCMADLGPVTKFTGTLTHTKEEIHVTIHKTGTVEWHSAEMIKTLNLIMKRNFRAINYAMLGRHHFDCSTRVPITAFGLELISGFATSVTPCDRNQILMVCDNVTKVARVDNCLRAMQEAFRSNSNTWMDTVKRDLVSQVVMTSYNNKTYRIDDVNFDMNPAKTFETKNGPLSFVEYYQTRHNVTIRDMKQPLLVVMPSERDKRAGRTDHILLVPELCQLTGLSDSQRANFNLMKAVAGAARLNPGDRVQKLNQFARKLIDTKGVTDNLNEWEVTFDPNLLKVEGVLLDEEQIFTGNGERGMSYEQKSADFSRQIRGAHMRQPVEFAKLACVYPQNIESQVREFLMTLQKVLGPMGCAMTLNKIKMTPLPNDRPGTYISSMSPLTESGNKAQLILCIVPTNAKERYDALKKYLCCDVGVPSQMVVAKTISNPKMLMSISTKIGIQMGVKIGAQPWSLNIPVGGLMVVGYDTYHDAARKGQSVGGFVASMNRDLTSWISRASFHSNANEMSEQLAQNVFEAMTHYHQVNKLLPNKILIYRDGVSDGQIQHCLEIEVGHIEEKLMEALGGNPESLPQVTVVIVTKRINARFYAPSGPNMSQIDNPSPGTVVDKSVTRRGEKDFFLVSQSVRQGTVAPTHYNIIHESQRDAASKPYQLKIHQKLAYKLTHLYFNWNGTIRVPAPVQYAHKLAYLVGTHTHQLPNAELSDKLHFL